MGGYSGFLMVIVVVGLLVGFRQTSGGMGLPLLGAALLGALLVMFGGLEGQGTLPQPALAPPEGGPRIVTETELIGASMAIAFGLGLLVALHRVFGWLAGLIAGVLLGFVLANHYVTAAQEGFALLNLVQDLVAHQTRIVLALIVAMLLGSIAMMVFLEASPFAMGFLLGALAGFAAICFALTDPRAAAAPLSFVFLMIFEFCAPGKAAELTLFAAMMLSSVAMMAVFAAIPFAAGWVSSRFVRLMLGR